MSTSLSLASGSFAPESLAPLERLQVNDGLLLTADRWRRAHAYHRQRQNLHFQALNQAGIVCGLGVRTITAPSDVAAQYQDGRWLDVQPGLAIDTAGNPIIVPQALTYRIAAQAVDADITVYLVLSYVDPERLSNQNSADQMIQETFRIHEQLSPAGPMEVELCRIQLAAGDVVLRSPQDPLAPATGEIDLCHRHWVRARSQGRVKVANYTSGNPVLDQHRCVEFEALFDAMYPLYSGLQGEGPVELVSATTRLEQLLVYDAIHMFHDSFLDLNPAIARILAQYLQQGGVLYLEVPDQDTPLEDLTKGLYDVRRAISVMEGSEGLAELRTELAAEIEELEACVEQEIEILAAPIAAFAQQHQLQLPADGFVELTHPLRKTPFTFARLPMINQAPLEMLNWGGIVLIVGDARRAWGADSRSALTREEVRSAQEFGINILHFAWQWRQLHEWLREPGSALQTS